MGTYALPLTEVELARHRWMADRARTNEAELWTAAGISAGARVADVGCGPGPVLTLLAERVGPAGLIVGVDGDGQAVEAARSHLAAAGIGQAEVRVGQAADSGLTPDSFDVVVLRNVLAHNGGREQAIVDHVASLARPGGVVYLVDVDLSGIRFFPSVADLDDLVDRYVAFHRGRGKDPRIGLRLAHLSRRAGLVLVEYRGWVDIFEPAPGLRPPPWAARDAMVADGAATADDVRRWGGAFERLDAVEERPLNYVPVFAVLARRAVSR